VSCQQSSCTAAQGAGSLFLSTALLLSLARLLLLLSILVAVLQRPANCQPSPEHDEPTRTLLTKAETGFEVCEIEIVGTAMWSGPGDFAVIDSVVFMVMSYGLQVLTFEELASEVQPKRYYMPDLYQVEVTPSLLFTSSLNQLSCLSRTREQFSEIPLDSVEVDGNILCMKVLGDQIYLLTPSSLVVVDFHSPSHMEVAVTVPITLNTVYGLGLEVTPEAVYIAAIDLYAVTELFSDTPVITNISPLRNARSLSVIGDILWLLTVSSRVPADRCDFEAYNISNPGGPTLVSRTTVQGELWSIYASEDSLYVAGGETGTAIFDVSDPELPFPVHCLSPIGSALQVYMEGGLLFIENLAPPMLHTGPWNYSLCRAPGDDSTPVAIPTGADTGDFAVFDVKSQEEPLVVGRYEHPGYARGLYRQGETVWVLDDAGDVRTLRMCIDGSISEGPLLKTPGEPQSLCAHGHVVAIADALGGLSLFDVSDTLQPRLVAQCLEGHYCCGVAIYGTTAYVAAGADGVYAIDISDPSDPRVLSQTPVADFALSVVLKDSLVLVADRFSGVSVFDGSQPESLRLISRIDGDGEGMWAIHLAVRDSLLVAAGGSNVYLLDIASISEPRLLSQFTSQQVSGIAVKDDLLFLAQLQDGIGFVDMSDPSNPIGIGTYATPGWAYALDVCGNELVVADDFGFLRLRADMLTSVEDDEEQRGEIPKTIDLHGNYPNPFNSSTTILYSVDRPLRARLDIINVLGQTVAVLVDRQLPGGNFRITWEGQDQHGGSVASGVYFARLEALDCIKSIKMVLLK